jgi:hypothetical protein
LPRSVLCSTAHCYRLGLNLPHILAMRRLQDRARPRNDTWFFKPLIRTQRGIFA